jgi:hypothetical protein
MDATQRAGLLQRWTVVQEELIPDLGREVEALTPRLEKLIHTLEWARIEDLVPAWQGIGRPLADRSALANGFVAKAVLGLSTTVALDEFDGNDIARIYLTATRVIVAVPEPETWAMLLAGLGLVGYAARRRGLTAREAGWARLPVRPRSPVWAGCRRTASRCSCASRRRRRRRRKIRAA